MKILQIAHSFLPYSAAGTEVYTYKISKELSKNNSINIFFRVNDSGAKEYTVTNSCFDGLQTYAINNTFKACNSFKDTYAKKVIADKLGELLDKLAPDIVHIHHLMFLSFGIVNEAKKRGIPVIYTLHDYWLLCYRGQLMNDKLAVCKGNSVSECESCLKYLLKIKKHSLRLYFFLRKIKALLLISILKRIYFFAIKKPVNDEITGYKESSRSLCEEIDLFIAPSHFMENKFIESGVPKNKILYSPYGIDKTRFFCGPRGNAGRDLIKFGYMGTLLPMKGPDILITAFKQLRSENIGLNIYGKLISYAGFETYHSILKKKVSQDRRIRLMGGYDNKQVCHILADIDILVVPSIWPENSPLVIHEAFSAGVPVIASRTGGIPELIADKVNGLLFEPGNAEDLKAKMEYVLENPEVIGKFKGNIPELKSIRENARELEKIYSELILSNSRKKAS